MVSSLPLRTSQKWPRSQDLKNQKGTEPEAFPGPGGGPSGSTSCEDDSYLDGQAWVYYGY